MNFFNLSHRNMIDTQQPCHIYLYDYTDDILSQKTDLLTLNHRLIEAGKSSITVVPTFDSNIFESLVSNIQNSLDGYWVLVITSSRFRNEKRDYKELQKKFSKERVIFARRSSKNFQSIPVLKKNHRYFHIKKKLSVIELLLQELHIV